MIKIILALVVMAVFSGKDCTATYSVTGDHLGNDADLEEGDSPVDVSKYGLDIAAELEQLLQLRNASLITAKYADDVVYAREGHPIAVGREQATELYQEWFDSGVYGSDITVIKTFMLGDDYYGALTLFTPFDNNRLNIGLDFALVIMKRTEAGDGFQTYLKAENVHYWQ